MNLLYCNPNAKRIKLNSDTRRHLAIDELINMIAVTDDDKEIVSSVFSEMTDNTETILYRQEILSDFLSNDSFCKELEEIIHKLDVLKEFYDHNHFLKEKKTSIWDLLDYSQEMEVYCQIIEGMNELFSKYTINSQGLKDISESIKEVIDSDRIAELKEIISSLRADISTVKSVNLGVNLDASLHPEEIVFMSFSGIPYRSKINNKTAWGISIASQKRITYNDPSPVMKFLSQELERELGKKVKKTKSDLKEYINLKGYFLLDIIKDLKYYLLIAKYANKLQNNGYSYCFPKIDYNADSVNIKGIYNIRLTEDGTENIVKNDFTFSEKEKIYILTGPNRGGKTMLTQAVGLSAFMASMGLFVTADSYNGYPFCDILTHFPADENLTLSLGRLGEEAVRVQQIVKEATPRTLVLFNETYSSTCSSDGLYLAKDLVHILKHNNVPVIFNTHIHELARSTEEMNQWDGPTDIVSLSMQIVDNVNTFKVLRSEPDICSYAHNIATKYGITYEQMLNNK